MRHHVAERKLGRKSAHRRAMLANLATSLILRDRIETTLPKAKELKAVAERLVTLGKRGTLHAQRRAVAITRNKGAVHKLFNELAHRFAERCGGYTRILKLGFRHGDAAPMAAIEYIPAERKAGAEEPKKEEKKARKAKAAEEKKEAARLKKAVHEEEKASQKAKPAAGAKKSAKRSSPVHRATRGE